MNIEFDTHQPIYVQIIDYFKIQLVTNGCHPGEWLPPVREVATQLQVNPNTVQKAFSELEREHLFISERTAGRHVTTDENQIQALRQAMIQSKVQGFVADMKRFHLSIDDMRALLLEVQKNEKDTTQTQPLQEKN